MAKYLGDQWSIGDWDGDGRGAARRAPGLDGHDRRRLRDRRRRTAPGRSRSTTPSGAGRSGPAPFYGVVRPRAHAAQSVKVPVLFTHHFRVDRRTRPARSWAPAPTCRPQRVRQLVTDAGQPFEYVACRPRRTRCTATTRSSTSTPSTRLGGDAAEGVDVVTGTPMTTTSVTLTGTGVPHPSPGTRRPRRARSPRRRSRCSSTPAAARCCGSRRPGRCAAPARRRVPHPRAQRPRGRSGRPGHDPVDPGPHCTRQARYRSSRSTGEPTRFAAACSTRSTTTSPCASSTCRTARPSSTSVRSPCRPLPVEVWRSDDGIGRRRRGGRPPRTGPRGGRRTGSRRPPASSSSPATPGSATRSATLATGADVLVHEACRATAMKPLIEGTPFERIFDYHADTVALGRAGRSGRGRRTSCSPTSSRHRRAPPRQEAFADDVREGGYTGALTVGHDLFSVDLT